MAGEGADILTGGAGADVLDLSESKPSSDKALINAGDSLANISEADTIKKFDLGKDSKTYDLLDLPVAIKVAADTNTTIDGKDAGAIKYHQITDGLVKFSATSSISISSSNLSNALDYLKANITDKSVVAFQASSDVWVFQDNGEIDTAVGLIGIGTIVGLETNAAAWASKVLHIA